MPRVSFSDNRNAGETEPLLRASSFLPTLSEEEVDSDGQLSESTSTLVDDASRTKGILIGRPRELKYSLSSGSKGDYLPLHRRRLRPRRVVSSWKAATLLVLAVLWIAAIIVSTFVFGVRIPTAPFPRPALHDGARTNPAVLITAKHGAVASENKVCSDVGVDVLKDGGNAVDSAIAVTFCIGVVNMFSSGIGGGGFMTVRLPPSSPGESSSAWTIDFREMAPAKANTTMFEEDPLSSLFGGLAVGVPGEVRGLEEAHKRWGTLPWKRLVQPSVDLAEGWKVSAELSKRIRIDFFTDLMLKNPDWSSIFAPNGILLEEGDLIRRVNLSRTLAAIAEDGPDAFYSGPIAEAIVNKVQATGGIITMDDLASYKVKVAPALEGTYRGKRVLTSHAPTSGPVLLHMLNILERFDLSGEGRTGLNTHRVVEAMKFGFAARTKLSDPAFANDTSRIDEISTKRFGQLISANITDDTTHSAEYYRPIFDVPLDHGTSHTSVVDKNGMAVALTSTVNLIFGSQVMDPITGILFNDEMDDFSTPGTPNAFGLWPSPFNYPEPGKRPLSSITPTILEHEDGSFNVALGGSGGSRIFGAVLQVLLGIDVWGLDASAAIEFGRAHDQLYPALTDVDDTLPAEDIEALRIRGHNVTVQSFSRIAAVIQVVMKEGDTIYAASDSRKNGVAAGY